LSCPPDYTSTIIGGHLSVDFAGETTAILAISFVTMHLALEMGDVLSRDQSLAA